MVGAVLSVIDLPTSIDNCSFAYCFRIGCRRVDGFSICTRRKRFVDHHRSNNVPRIPMRNQLIFGLLCISIISLSACYRGTHLHPVSGPATAESHVANIKVSGTFNSGTFIADLTEERVFHGDFCKGRWKAATQAMPPSANEMASVWDTVYGNGYYAAQILGAKRCARGSGACKDGGVLEAEICQIENRQNRKTTKVGVARDNKNNIYRILF